MGIMAQDAHCVVPFLSSLVLCPYSKKSAGTQSPFCTLCPSRPSYSHLGLRFALARVGLSRSAVEPELLVQQPERAVGHVAEHVGARVELLDRRGLLLDGRARLLRRGRRLLGRGRRRLDALGDGLEG